MEISLLTGAVLEVRKWKLSDMDILLQAVGRGFLPALLRVFSGNTIQVLDPGIYPTPWNWGKVYEGDLYDALWQWRALSVGPKYPFTIQCPACRQKIEVEFEVDKVARRPIPEELLAHLREGRNRVAVDFSAGSFTFIVPTADEAQAMMNTSDRRASVVRQKGSDHGDLPETSLTKTLRQKLVSVVSDGETYEGGKLTSWLADLDLDVAGEVLAIMEENSFGIDNAVELTCGNCSQTFPGEIPMQKSFFLSAGGKRSGLSPMKTP